MVYRGELVSGICLAPLGRPPFRKVILMYPQIVVERKDNQFVVQEHPTEQPNTWRMHYKGPEKSDVVTCVCDLLSNHPNAFLVMEKDSGVQGYLFQIRGPERTTRFFRSTDQVVNPFRNRKTYAEANKTSVVSFHPMGFE